MAGNPTSARAVPRADSSGSDFLEFDFGPVLAHGQTLRHQFTLKNPTRGPIRLLEATANTPCCSEVEECAKVVPPGGDATVTIRLSPGYRSGRKAATFVVRTDSSMKPEIRLAVLANITSAWEVVALGTNDETLRLGRSGTQRFRIICRRTASEGRGCPEHVKTSAALTANFEGPAHDRELPGALIESTRDVSVSLPARAEPGSYREDVLFQWPEGHQETTMIAWKVVPWLQVNPSGLVVPASAAPVAHTISVSAADRPFRIISVSGPLLAEEVACPMERARTHQLRILLDTSRKPRAGASEVQVRTDHPEQGSAVMSVLVLSDEPGAVP